MHVDVSGEEKPKYSVCIAMPIYGAAEPNFMMSVIALCLTFVQNNIPFSLYPHSDSLITRSRNTMVNMVLHDMEVGAPDGPGGERVKRDYTHVLFLDSDLIFYPELIMSLLEADKDIIGGVYPVRGYDWDKIVAAAKEGKSAQESRLAGARYVLNWAHDNKKVETLEDGSARITSETTVDKGVFEVTDVGTGLMLIKTSCLKKMANKCKKYLYDMPGPHYHQPMRDFFGTYVDEHQRFLSEDYAFCARWRKMGGKIYAMMSMVSHIGKCTFEGNPATLTAPSKPEPDAGK